MIAIIVIIDILIINAYSTVHSVQIIIFSRQKEHFLSQHFTMKLTYFSWTACKVLTSSSLYRPTLLHTVHTRRMLKYAVKSSLQHLHRSYTVKILKIIWHTLFLFSHRTYVPAMVLIRSENVKLNNGSTFSVLQSREIFPLR